MNTDYELVAAADRGHSASKMLLWYPNGLENGWQLTALQHSSDLKEFWVIMRYKVMLDLNKQHRHGNMLINADLNLMEARKHYPRTY